MTRFVTSIRALLGERATTTDSLFDRDGECPVCDHPFGDLPHMCLASATGVLIAS